MRAGINGFKQKIYFQITFINIKVISLLVMSFLIGIDTAGQSRDLPLFPLDSLTHKIKFTDIVYLDSTSSKQDLFLRAREWFAKTFKSSNYVTQMEDKEAGILIGKGSLEIFLKVLGSSTGGNYFNFTISLYFKDGRYKYDFTDFTYSNGISFNDTPAEYLYNAKENDYPRLTKNGNREVFSQLRTKMDLIVTDLRVTMSKASVSQDNKW